MSSAEFFKQKDFTALHDAETTGFKIIDEEILIKRVFDNDPRQGCEILFKKYYKILCSHAIRLVCSKEAAEDIVGEIFCRFWSDRIYLSINTSYRAYLFKAVRFSAYNYIRWELSKRRKEIDTDSLLDQINSFRPEETMLFDELAAEISRSIENLPNQCRRIFMLSRFENLKYHEIAAKLGISVKAVEAQVSKALDVLRTRLKSSDLIPIALIACFLNG
ncbi:MAG TPA: RNA polymerase sigma-70 factor [Ohtaekwangia sp.]|nr:RNA polymerase sigma-70 factor [Ohtaekwangia sp.]